MDIVINVISNFNLPLSLWNEALKTAMFILNKLLSKAVAKIAFELWKRWKPRLNYIPKDN